MRTLEEIREKIQSLWPGVRAQVGFSGGETVIEIETSSQMNASSRTELQEFLGAEALDARGFLVLRTYKPTKGHKQL